MNRDSRIVEIEIEKIVPNRFQPRKTFDEDISELAESIRAHGVLQPITVRPLGEKYEIIMGERRYRACEKLGMNKIPCMIVEMTDREAMEVALIENLQRQDLSPIEEALSYKRILEAGYITQDQLAQRLGKTQSTIANKLRLLSLDKEVQAALLKSAISERHARAMLSLSDKEMQKSLLKKIIEEKLTVKKTEEEIRKMEKGIYENKNNDQSVEIIDFDDNPFKDPTPEPQPVDNYKPEVPEPGDFAEKENVSSNPFDDAPKKSVENNRVTISVPKNKASIPSMGIIDDFKDNNQNLVESNHGFESNFVDEERPNEPEEAEEIVLDDVKPDEIVAEEPKTETFDEMIQNGPTVANDFEQIKAVIEKCQNELKALGYKVEYEKFDFESMYQIILKIDKK